MENPISLYLVKEKEKQHANKKMHRVQQKLCDKNYVTGFFQWIEFNLVS